MENLNINPKCYISFNRYPDFREMEPEISKKFIRTVDTYASWYHMLKRNDERNYEDLLTIYREVISKIGNFLDSDIDRITLLSYVGELLYSGCFSYGNYYEYSTNSNPEVAHALGMNVLYGKGCCRNEASFIGDLLKEIGISSYPISGAISPVNRSFMEKGVMHYYSKDNSNIKKEKLIHLRDFLITSSFYHKFIADHMIVTTSYSDMVIGYDVTNGALYKVDGYNARIINGIGNIRLVPTTLASMKGYNFHDMMDYCDFVSSSDTKCVPNRELINRYHDGLELFRKSEKTIKEIRSSIEEDLKEINEIREKEYIKK